MINSSIAIVSCKLLLMPSLNVTHYVESFSNDITHITAPEKFTFPFCYQPHPLAKMAAEQLQQQIQNQLGEVLQKQGKMFGVLVVTNASGKLGFISAFSGDPNTLPLEQSTIPFVPSVFKGFDNNSWFSQQHLKVNRLNADIQALEQNPNIALLKQQHINATSAFEQIMAELQHKFSTNKQQRKQEREKLSDLFTQQKLSKDEWEQQLKKLSSASIADKKLKLKTKQYWQHKIDNIVEQLSEFQQSIDQLKKQRSKCSTALQKHLFKQYQFSNKSGEIKDVLSLFKGHPNSVPPAGTGDCAAPKLLQFAFEQQLTPVCMAEFWWGAQPKSQIRQQGNYYPACQGKCQPILTHMLAGMTVDDNPLLNNPGQDKPLSIIFHDQHIAVVNKPEELLSVPGKFIQDSVYTRIQQLFPDATGPIILHRLDMSTSGLLLVALSARAHKHLQQQFIRKEIRKKYIAVINKRLNASEGKIQLPLIGDINDRPRQMVSHQHGKYAETLWQVISTTSKSTRLSLTPVTGRTHQLRVHCAHPDGLNCPIVGDDLYGTAANRLHLHAHTLEFQHPVSKAMLSFCVEPNF